MKLFSCKVRLKGDARDEVRKVGVTKAEMQMLGVHHDVVEVEEIGDRALSTDRDRAAKGELRTVAEERYRLEGIYGERAVNALFGVPQAVIGDDDEPAMEPAVRKARRTRETVEASEMAAAANSTSAESTHALA